jgi:nitrogen regulatory protein PII-like uncharacterized protein
MKNLIVCFILFILSSVNCYAQKNGIVFLDSHELAVMVNYESKNKTFTKYFLFEFKGKLPIDFSKFSEIKIIESSATYLKLLCDKSEVCLNIEEGKKHNFGIQINGFGLSERIGNFSLNTKKINQEISNLSELFMVNSIESGGSGKLTCHSGGTGATSCSVKPSNISVGTPECSVTCSSGYHACCDDTRGECKCNPNPSSKPNVPQLSQF